MARIGTLLLVAALLGWALPAWWQPACAQSEIRVVLSDTAGKATVAGNINWSSAEGKTGASGDLAYLELKGGSVNLDTPQFRCGSTRVTAAPASGYIRFAGREYRGRLEFFAGKSGGLVVLNVLPLEDYLLGVVPGEMPASWPAEALRAQAVAARTYAVSRMQANRDARYDVYATVADQVYAGVEGEDPRTSAAVQETAGQILTYQGAPIVAFYSADAGGYTKQGSLPYLCAVPSLAPDSPHSNWEVTLSAAELERIAAGVWQGCGKLQRIDVANDPQSGHLLSLLLIGDQGRVKLNPGNLRKALGYNVMKSTRARVYAAGGAAVHVPAPSQSAPAVAQPGETVPVVHIEPYPGSEEQSAAATPATVEVAPVAAETIPDASALQEPQPAGGSAQTSWTPEAAGSYPEGTITVGSRELQDYERPFVAWADDARGLKLRHLFAFNGSDLLQCEQQFSVVNVAEIIAPPWVPRAQPTPPKTTAPVTPPTSAPAEPVPPEPTPEFLPDPLPLTPPPGVSPDTLVPDETSIELNGGGIVIRGSGYGHGVGLSQWGAKQLATEGRSYVEILKYFYRGVELANLSGLPGEPAPGTGVFYEPFTSVQ